MFSILETTLWLEQQDLFSLLKLLVDRSNLGGSTYFAINLTWYMYYIILLADKKYYSCTQSRKYPLSPKQNTTKQKKKK